MRPVLQRHLMDDVPKGKAEAAVNAGHVAGDCIRACVASIMEAELDQVPHFVQYIEHPEGTDTHLWYWALLGFCHASGWRVEWTEDKPDGWSMVEGRSPRGHMHPGDWQLRCAWCGRRHGYEDARAFWLDRRPRR